MKKSIVTAAIGALACVPTLAQRRAIEDPRRGEPRHPQRGKLSRRSPVSTTFPRTPSRRLPTLSRKICTASAPRTT